MRDYPYGDTMNRDRNRYEDRGSERGAFFDRGRYDRQRSSDRWSDNERDGRSERRFGRSIGSDLIASDRVEGTAVYGRDGNKLGTIHNFMVEKRGGQVRYAVMKCSEGFLGLDQRYYPLDWQELDYDTRLDGYRINMSERDLDDRRSFDSRGRPFERNYDRGQYGYGW